MHDLVVESCGPGTPVAASELKSVYNDGFGATNSIGPARD